MPLLIRCIGEFRLVCFTCTPPRTLRVTGRFMWDVSLNQAIRNILNSDRTRGGWPRFNWLPVAIALLVLAAWYLFTLDSAEAFIVASPGAVARQFLTTLSNGTLIRHIGTTLIEVGVGFTLGV